jgi:hypothetical protein
MAHAFPRMGYFFSVWTEKCRSGSGATLVKSNLQEASNGKGLGLSLYTHLQFEPAGIDILAMTSAFPPEGGCQPVFIRPGKK